MRRPSLLPLAWAIGLAPAAGALAQVRPTTAAGRPRGRASTGSALAALLLLLAVVGAAAPSLAADERTFPLQDGSRVVLRADGSMGHYSASGAPVPMREGEEMIASDGTRLLMKGDALWRQVVDYAASSFALASAFPFVRNERGERWIDLADGGRVGLRTDGTMVHLDAAGKPVAMADGEVMIARDGTPIMMKGASLWGAMGPRGAPRARP